MYACWFVLALSVALFGVKSASDPFEWIKFRIMQGSWWLDYDCVFIRKAVLNSYLELLHKSVGFGVVCGHDDMFYVKLSDPLLPQAGYER